LCRKMTFLRCANLLVSGLWGLVSRGLDEVRGRERWRVVDFRWYGWLGIDIDTLMGRGMESEYEEKGKKWSRWLRP
jgi:hypothetical protein